MNEGSLRPFTKDWYWQLLLDQVYLCKWKYRDLEEMKSDSELTEFIIDRLERKIKDGILEDLEIFRKLNEDDLDRGKGKHLLKRFIESNKQK